MAIHLLGRTKQSIFRHMMAVTIRGSDFPPQSVADKCGSDYKSLVNKKKISMDATGDQKNNALVIFLQCQVKTGSKNCKDAEKEYSRMSQIFHGHEVPTRENGTVETS
jgi:hypothetical protein